MNKAKAALAVATLGCAVAAFYSLHPRAGSVPVPVPPAGRPGGAPPAAGPADAEVAKILAETNRLQNQGDYKGARAVLEREDSRTADPNFRLALAQNLLDEGSVRSRESQNAPRARAILLELERAGHKSAYLYQMLAHAHELEGRYPEAIKGYQKALDYEAASPNALFGLGHTYWLSGDRGGMEAFYASAEASISSATSSEVRTKVFAGRGLVALRQGRAAEAEKLLQGALSATSAKAFRAELLADLAGLRLAQGDAAGAFELARQAIAADGSQELGYLNLASAALEEKSLLEKNLPAVRQGLFKALLLNPRRSGAYFTQGRLDFVLGRPKYALKDFEQALKLLPADNTVGAADKAFVRADIYLQLTACHQMLRQPQAAVASLKSARKWNPAKTKYMVRKFGPFKQYSNVLGVVEAP